MKIRSPDDIRVLDSDGFKRRAACLCLREVAASSKINITNASQQQQREVLLISSAKNAEKWLIPGGGVAPGEDVATAAARESFEVSFMLMWRFLDALSISIKGCIVPLVPLLVRAILKS